jgi:hypothetical protein
VILEFCPDLKNVTWRRGMNPASNMVKKRNESSKQRDEDHHASNHSSIILDDTRTLTAIYIR